MKQEEENAKVKVPLDAANKQVKELEIQQAKHNEIKNNLKEQTIYNYQLTN